MSTMWIVTANGSFAKIFEVKGIGKQIKEIHHLDNPDGRLKNGDVLSDRPGRTFDRMGVGRHAYSEVDYHEQEQKLFAKKIAEILHHGRENKSFEELVFVAPDRFLGELNAAISPSVKKNLVKEIHKDLPEYLSEQERIDHLCKYLDLWNRSGVA